MSLTYEKEKEFRDHINSDNHEYETFVLTIRSGKLLLAEIDRLRAKCHSSLGVGDGTGQLFVHGNYDSVKACQAILLERDQLREKVDVAEVALRHYAEPFQYDKCSADESKAVETLSQIQGEASSEPHEWTRILREDAE